MSCTARVLFTMRSPCHPCFFSQAVRESALDVTAAETLVMEFILRHVPASGTAALAGSSIHVDRAFLSRYMPRIVAHCSHR